MFFYFSPLKYLAFILFVILLSACALPAQNFSTTALGYGFTEKTLTTSTFRHPSFLVDSLN